MSLNQNLLLSIYQKANRTGLLDTPIAQRFFWYAYCAYKHYLEDPFANLGRRYPQLFAAGSVLDVGANIGYTAQVFCKLIDPEYRVIAFEPEPSNFRQLQINNEAAISAKRLQALQLAVGANDGSVVLKLNPDHHADHKVIGEAEDKVLANSIIVEQCSLDSFCSKLPIAEPIVFIKIDVQGYELAVCQGLATILERNPNACVALEYSPDSMAELGYAPQQLFDFFSERAFKFAVILRSGHIKPISVDEMDQVMADKPYTDLLFYPESLTFLSESKI